ncbi:hypothetical protein Tco_0321748 [Tanacetum coccineum]
MTWISCSNDVDHFRLKEGWDGADWWFSSHLTGNKAYLSEMKDYNGRLCGFWESLCDNGHEFFKKPCMNEISGAKKGIKRGVLAEAVNILSDVYWNRVFSEQHQNKTPYETINRKFDGISVYEGYLLGYSTTSKAFRVYNKRTKMVEENLHINFLEVPNDVQDSEDDKEGQHQMTEDEQVLHDELEKMIAQEVIAKALDDATRQAFEEEKRNTASQMTGSLQD